MSQLVKRVLENNGLKPSTPAESGDGGQGGAGGGGNSDDDLIDPNKPPERKPDEPVKPPVTEDDITDDLLLRALAKRGKNVTSLDDINRPAEPQLTEEQLREIEQERQNKIRTFALTQGKVTSTDFDEFAKESSVADIDLALQLYIDQRLDAARKAGKAEADLPTAEELEVEFGELNFQFAAEDDPKRITAENRIRKEVDAYRKSKYSKIYSLDSEYNQFEQSAALRSEYDSTINQVFTEAETEFAELSFDIPGDKKGETFTYKYKPTKETIAALRNQYSSDASFGLLGQSGVNAASLKEAAKGSLIQAELGNIIAEVSKAHAAEAVAAIQKGRRHIPVREGGDPQAPAKVNATVRRIIEKNKELIH